MKNSRIDGFPTRKILRRVSYRNEGNVRDLIRYSCRYTVFDAFVDLCKSTVTATSRRAEKAEGGKKKRKRKREGGSEAKREDGKTNDTRGYKRLHDNFKLYELHTRVNILPHRCRRIL